MDAIFLIYKSSFLKYGDKDIEAQLKKLSTKSMEYEQAYLYQVENSHTTTFFSFLHSYMIPYDVHYEQESETALENYEDKFSRYLRKKQDWIKLFSASILVMKTVLF